jgi:CHAT domain-containing protein
VQFENALGVYERAAPAQPLEAAATLDRLAWAQIWVERYDQAEATSTRALESKQRLLGSADAGLTPTLTVRGLVYQRKGDYTRARADLERAVDLSQQARPTHPETAAALIVLGEERWLEGDPLEARRLLMRAVEIAQSSLRPDHPDIAASLKSLAVPVEDLGDLQQARSLRERGLDIAERALGPNHPLVGAQLGDLAISRFDYGDHAGARRLYERALSIFEKRLGPDHSYVPTIVHNLAWLSVILGDFREASRLEERALATWQRTRGPDHPYVSLALWTFGSTLAEQGRDREAVPMYERAIRSRERSLGPMSTGVAEVLTSLAASYGRLGQRRKAMEISRRGLSIWEGSAVPAGLADALIVDGRIQADDRNYEGARRSYARAFDLRLQLLGPAHPLVAETEVALSSMLAILDPSSDAMRLALQGEEIAREHPRLMLRSLPERQGLEYAATRPNGLNVALSLLAGGAHGNDVAAGVLDGVIRSRGLVLDEMADRSLLRRRSARPDLALRWQEMVSARQRFAALVIRGPRANQSEDFSALLAEARDEKERAERAFAEQSGDARGTDRREVTLETVRSALPPQAALVSVVRYDRTIVVATSPKPAGGGSASESNAPGRRVAPSYLAFVVRAGTADVTAVPLGPAATIDALVTAWRLETTGAVRAERAQDSEAEYRKAGAALRRRVWDPLRPALRTATRVFFVPDGSLNLVSLASLPVGDAGYLMEQAAVIHYLSAERDLVSGETSPSTSDTGTEGLLALGGPSFDDGSSFRNPSKSAAVPAAADGGCPTLQTARFEPLPGTTREVRDVAALWKGSRVRVLEGGAATEAAFKREAPGHRVLHLATHGFFLGAPCGAAAPGTRSVGGVTVAGQKPVAAGPADNPLVLSGLALAGANRRTAAGPGDEDGVLTAEEVSSLNLSGVEWAVLSACETGLGAVRAGEGVFGLRRAFQVAGVHTVIMSLWAVDDTAAQLWMRALYVNRLQRHLATADAVRAASLTLLRQRRARGESTHPFYWAAFVAAGDWR